MKASAAGEGKTRKGMEPTKARWLGNAALLGVVLGLAVAGCDEDPLGPAVSGPDAAPPAAPAPSPDLKSSDKLRLTGGGRIDAPPGTSSKNTPDSRVFQTFGVTVGDEDGDGVPSGQLNFTDHTPERRIDGSPLKLKAVAWSSFHQTADGCSDAGFVATGTVEVRNSGERLDFRLEGCDNGEPGTEADSFSVTVFHSDGTVRWEWSGLHTGGNGQAHKGKGGETVPATGDLEVISATTGSDVDADGYTVVVDGSSSQALGVNDTTVFTGLAEGDHTVELTGVAANCTVSGSNPRTVTITADSTTSSTFSVSCEATTTEPATGDLEVTTATTGEEIDPDGYTVTIDGPGGTETRSIGTDGTITFSGIDAGDYSVELGDIATNCTLSGDNPRTVTVPDGGTGSTTFDIACEATNTEPSTGDLEVISATTGSDVDADGYTVVVDGSSSQALGVNDTTVFTGLAEGDHTVELTGVAANCTVSGSNPRTATITADSTTSSTFSVSCEATTTGSGDLTITTATTGSDIPTSYTVAISGPESGTFSFGPNETRTFPDVTTGDYTVEITDAPANCTISGSNPRTVTVPDGGTGSTTFDVACEATSGGTTGTGDLTVTTATTGEDIDPDGYTVAITGPESGSFTFAANETRTFSGVTAGDYTIELSGIAANCTLSGENPRVVTVPDGGTGSTTFDIACEATSTGGDGGGGTGATITGDGAIGTGSATAGSDRQEFLFDVDDSPGGTFDYTDYAVVRSDGSVATITVDPSADASTGVTSFTQTSSACVSFDATGRVDDGSLIDFTVNACDNGSPGAGTDTFELSAPDRPYQRGPDVLSEGDIVFTP